MDIDPTSPHTLWSGALTLAGTVVAFATKRLYKEVDEKADSKVVEQRFAQQADAIKLLITRQDEQHKANTERLDRIYSAIATRNGP